MSTGITTPGGIERFINRVYACRMESDMEPELKTAAALRPVLRELVRLEPLFHRPELGTSRRDFEAMTAPDFWEVGASGRRYSREYVLDVLESRQDDREPDAWSAIDFHCRSLGSDVYLLTYTL